MNHRDSDKHRGKEKQYNYYKGFNQIDHERSNPLPDCSDVRQNINSDNLLAGSELSLLERIAEINDRMCDSALMNEKEEQYVPKPINEMKFSFNKNNAFPISNEVNTSVQTTKRNSTLKDIYYKQFQRQSSRIKEVQEARKKLLSNTNEKRIVKNGNNNKQNLVGSIKRKNYSQDKLKLTNGFSKSTLHSEAPAQCKNIEPGQGNRQSIDSKDEQEGISLKYLQDSLARRKQTRIPLTKQCYLEANSSHKQPTYHNSDPNINIQIRQFNTRQNQFITYLEELFNQLDRMKVGKLDRVNCCYQSLRQEFKIAFGYILIRIKMKDLILNQQQFVRLGLQTIKQLDSQQFNHLLQDLKKVKQIFPIQNLRLEETIKKNYHERQIAKNRSRYLSVRQIDQSPCYLTLGAKDVEDFHAFLTKIQKKYESMPGLKYPPYNQKVGRKKINQYELYNPIDFIAPSLKIGTQQLKFYQDRNFKSAPKKENPQGQFGRLLTFNDEQFIKQTSPPKYKKARNISEQMILQHKRNLELILKLKKRVEECVFKSRKVIQEHSAQKYDKEHLSRRENYARLGLEVGEWNMQI